MGFGRGSIVVYTKEKHGTAPGPRARHVRGAVHGDEYAYVVEKYWIVAGREGERRLVLKTPGGKTHVVDEDDPHLRSPTWRERLWLHLRDRSRLGALRSALD